MISLAEARAHVLDRCPGPVVSEVPLADARGLVTAAPVVATGAVPPFANSAMDGFALLAADTVGPPAELRVVGTLAAGAVPDVEVRRGEAVRIMTGAPMPSGADAVVMVERTAVSDDGAVVTVAVEVGVGNHVRSAGEDLLPGAELFAPGTTLGPGHLGVLASIGCVSVTRSDARRCGIQCRSRSSPYH